MTDPVNVSSPSLGTEHKEFYTHYPPTVSVRQHSTKDSSRKTDNRASNQPLSYTGRPFSIYRRKGILRRQWQTSPRNISNSLTWGYRWTGNRDVANEKFPGALDSPHTNHPTPPSSFYLCKCWRAKSSP